MAKNHSNSEKGIPLPPLTELLFSINRKGSYRQASTYDELYYTSCGALSGTKNSSVGPP